MFIIRKAILYMQQYMVRFSCWNYNKSPYKISRLVNITLLYHNARYVKYKNTKICDTTLITTFSSTCFGLYSDHHQGDVLIIKIQYACMFCTLLFNFVYYIFFYVYLFLLFSMFCSGYSVSLRCSVYCLCVNVCCATAIAC